MKIKCPKCNQEFIWDRTESVPVTAVRGGIFDIGSYSISCPNCKVQLRITINNN